MRMLKIETPSREVLVDIGARVEEEIRASGVEEGVAHLWVLHTTCALTVNENADPDVATDMVAKMQALVPHHEPYYRHAEGNSDSHVKTSLFGPGLTLLIQGGKPVLGRWQGIYLAEWDGPRTRRMALKVMSG